MQRLLVRQLVRSERRPRVRVGSGVAVAVGGVGTGTGTGTGTGAGHVLVRGVSSAGSMRACGGDKARAAGRLGLASASRRHSELQLSAWARALSSSSSRFWGGAGSSSSEEAQDAPFGITQTTEGSVSSLIARETERLTKENLLPLNEAIMGPLEKRMARTVLPTVLVLGNHSSGKSSFINQLAGRSLQETGVAPTDDGFTLIAPGRRDHETDGPSLVGDPDLGFESLRSFGPVLVGHVKLKVRTDFKLAEPVMLIDSPGMIDSPVDDQRARDPKLPKAFDRGYDFEGVVRWLAEQADLILLLFDPDKPGTTGETLSVLTHSLAGLDHKLLIVLNKVDLFVQVQDFARSYGSLCWNLSKVIPRKDLPRIFTTSLLEGGVEEAEGSGFIGSSKDIERSRNELIDEIRRAPERRVHNMITQLYDSTRLLLLHAELMEMVRTEYHTRKWRSHALTAAIALGGNTLSLAVISLVPEVWAFSATVSVSSILGAVGMHLWGQQELDKTAKSVQTNEGLDALFRKRYLREIVEGDDFVQAMWSGRVRTQLQAAIGTLGVAQLPRVSSRDIAKLEKILDSEVPALRRKAAPVGERF